MKTQQYFVNIKSERNIFPLSYIWLHLVIDNSCLDTCIMLSMSANKEVGQIDIYYKLITQYIINQFNR